MSAWTLLLVVAAAVSCASHTIAKEKVFEPLRKVLGEKRTWIGTLVSCPYCLSHWIAFLLVGLTGLDIFPIRWSPSSTLLAGIVYVVSSFFTALVVVAIAAAFRVVFYLIDESQGLLRREEKQKDRELGT